MSEKEKIKRLEAEVAHLKTKIDTRDWRQKKQDAKDCEAMRENIACCRDVHWGTRF